MTRHLFIATLILSGMAGLAHAEPAYLDDRSDPAKLVGSLYNAINRKEYARAYSYFTNPMPKEFEAFVKGYADTASVDLLTGTVTADAAAGNRYYGVPVAIRATTNGSEEQIFAGCYTLHMANAAIQAPTFRPLAIEKASLKKSDKSNLEEALPASCGEGEAEDKEAVLLAEAKARYLLDQKSQCDKLAKIANGEENPEVFSIAYKDAFEETERQATLFAFPCGMGAYNTFEVYYLHTEFEGLRQLSFAAPEIDYQYADEESAKLKSWGLTGFTASTMLVNSAYDEKTKSISMFSKWRGIADASSNATWRFEKGAFVLKDYDVDPTFDGEINAFEVMKDGRLQPPP
jgi:hypothetical protein